MGTVWFPALLLASLFADARTLFTNAEQALRSNDLAAAERGFREFLELQPSHVGALGNLGVVYSRMGRYQDAVFAYERGLKLAPKSANLNLNLGLVWLKQDDHRSARVWFERAAALRPDHDQTMELLATAQLFTGDVDKAVAILESLPATQSVQYLLSIGYLKQNRRDHAREMIDRLFDLLSPAQAHLLAGRAYYESTLFEQAVAELTKARDLDSNLPGVWRELGKAQVSLRRSEQALTNLRQAVKRDPTDAEACYFLGALLVQEGSAKEGVDLLERSRRGRPAFWGAWYYLGKAAMAAGDPLRAADLLRRALELHGEEMAVTYQLARALNAAGLHAESRKWMNRYMELRAQQKRETQEALVAR